MSILMEIYIAGAVSSAEIFRSEESGSLSPDTQHISMHYFSAAALSFQGCSWAGKGDPRVPAVLTQQPPGFLFCLSQVRSPASGTTPQLHPPGCLLSLPYLRSTPSPRGCLGGSAVSTAGRWSLRLLRVALPLSCVLKKCSQVGAGI